MSDSPSADRPPIRPHADGVLVDLKVVPNASRDRVAGLLGDRIKLQLQAPAQAGKANRAACRLLAERLNLPRHAVEIQSGQTRPEKTALARGITAEQTRQRLALP